MTEVDLRFPHNYDLEADPELPAGTNRVRQIEFTQEGLHPGPSVIIRVRAAGESWVGVFAGEDSAGGQTGIYSCPDPDRICVVAGGLGYFVTAHDPTDWSPIQTYPIIDIAGVVDTPVLVLANFTHLVGIGKVGVVWETERVSYDGIKLTEATRKQVRGLAWSAPRQRWVEFTVDTLTGRHRGGASP